MEDPQTGLRFEWQIGTGATTSVYEKEGIDLPEGVELAPGMHRDIHDIEYDIFAGIAQKYPDLHQFYDLPLFHAKVDEVSADAGLHGDQTGDFDGKLKQLHEVASDKLKLIVKDKGADWLKQFYH